MSFYRPCYAARTRLTSTGEEDHKFEEPQHPAELSTIMLVNNSNGRPVSRTFFKMGHMMVWVYSHRAGDINHAGADADHHA
jgi:hypothetical protein